MYTLDQLIELADSVLYRITREQAEAIGKAAFEAEAAGENSAIWHQSALYFGYKCNCVPCAKKS